MTEKTDLLSTFVNSITRIEAYSVFLRQSFGRAMLYLLVLSLIFSGLISLKSAVEINSAVNELAHYFSADFPDFVLENGELSVDAEMPIIDDTDGILFTVDTTGTIDESILDDYEEGIFISKYEVVQKTGFETNIYQFSSFEGFTLTKDDVQRWLPYLKWVTVFVVIFGFIFYFLGKLFSALIVSLGGLIIEAAVKQKVGFANLYKLSVYALTVPILLKLLLSLTGMQIPYFWVVYYGMAFFYLWKALQTIRDDNEAAPNEINTF